MQGERSLARLMLNYIKKHGDTVDHDEAEKCLSELDQEDAKRAECLSGPKDDTPVATPIEGEAAGQGVQLSLVEDDAKVEAPEASVAEPKASEPEILHDSTKITRKK